MVKMIALKCPECGSKLQIEDGHKECFCQYCGHKILLDDGSVGVNMNVNTTHTYHKVDDARLKEAEVDKLIRIKELEMKEAEFRKNEQIRDIKIKCTIILGIIAVISMIFQLHYEVWIFIACVVMWKIGSKNKNNTKKEDSK